MLVAVWKLENVPLYEVCLNKETAQRGTSKQVMQSLIVELLLDTRGVTQMSCREGPQLTVTLTGM